MTLAQCMAKVYDVAVVGGGLAGLCVANSLAAQGQSVVVLEAHPTRMGGRLRNTESGLDLGAAWVWPHAQKNVVSLLDQLNITTFPQPGDPGSTRVTGGTFALVEGLVRGLEPDQLRQGWVLESATLEEESETVLLTPAANATSDAVRCKRAVLAVPPRLLSSRVAFAPALDAAKARAMRDSRTWMAGVTKVCVEYPTKFWPPQLDPHMSTGLRQGPGMPAFQMYDAR
jgi:monoamine oxidase